MRLAQTLPYGVFILAYGYLCAEAYLRARAGLRERYAGEVWVVRAMFIAGVVATQALLAGLVWGATWAIWGWFS